MMNRQGIALDSNFVATFGSIIVADILYACH